MRTWTLEKAKNGFSEVVRLALDHEPQLVTRGRSGTEAVVVISREDYERLVAPADLYNTLRQSPLARAVAEGLFDAHDPFPRASEYSREPDFGSAGADAGLPDNKADDEADATGLP
jgi:prevent-host-death family protein